MGYFDEDEDAAPVAEEDCYQIEYWTSESGQEYYRHIIQTKWSVVPTQ